MSIEYSVMLKIYIQLLIFVFFWFVIPHFVVKLLNIPAKDFHKNPMAKWIVLFVLVTLMYLIHFYLLFYADWF